ncbi:hypothetical protein FRB98_000718 [Tulasnella sp. 332]|nr:hypothetical protein FRB98_000718 [Tulasnella sp. 332]
MWACILITVSLVLSALSVSLPILESPTVKRSIASRTFGATLRTVENSGVCETTPGVHTVSGYIDVNDNENYAKKASKAPLVLWFNGGPGCSSMIGLFQENGPCRVNADKTTTTVNPNSWNAVANVMYIDQPIGSGFSHGTENADSSESAASKIWVMLQTFFETYPQYEGRELILATESYGGHWGPEFVTYFDAQNKQIRQGKLKGEVITVGALMLNNGWIDPITQYASYPGFGSDPPGYAPFINDISLNLARTAMQENGGCRDQLEACNAPTGSNALCYDAYLFCTDFVYSRALGFQDPYDIRSERPDPLPPSGYINYLQQPNIQKAIGAEVTYLECNGLVFNHFVTEGDLGALANTKLKILIWYGDADYICNWVGGLALTREMDWYGKSEFGMAKFQDVKISGVGDVGAVINVDNFSFLRVSQAGHEVPFYQPEASLEFLKQVIAKQPIHSV